MRTLWGAFAIAVVLGGLPGGPPEVWGQQPLRIRLAVHTATMGATDTIALRLGYFKEAGLEVDWRRFQTGKAGRDAMVGGSIDINSTAASPFLIGLSQKVPYVAVAVNSHFCGSNAIVVLKNSEITSIAQIKGKKFATARGTITDHIFAAKMGPAHGLKPGEYQVANMDAKDRIAALVSKAVDVASLTEPFMAVAEHEGIIRVLEDFCKYDPMPFMLTATNKIVQENPAAVVAYLRGWVRAVNLLKEQPEKAAQAYWEDKKETGYSVPLRVIDKALRRMRWDPEITQETERYLVDQIKDLQEAKHIQAVPDVARSLNRDLLRKATAAR